MRQVDAENLGKAVQFLQESIDNLEASNIDKTSYEYLTLKYYLHSTIKALNDILSKRENC